VAISMFNDTSVGMVRQLRYSSNWKSSCQWRRMAA